MNQIVVPNNFGPVSKVFQGQAVQDDLSSGVQAGFGILSYRGKVWRLKYRGEEKPIMRQDGDGPVNNVEVVIVKASPVISKIYYIEGYAEGSNAPPDCFSTNGQVPDPASPKLQCKTCAACPHNVWGSRITPAGKKTKACADSKRLAVVPLNDITNEAYGGPLLLRVPAASLQDMAGYGTKLKTLGYPYFGVATRISFDHGEAFPKFVFGAIRPLTDDEGRQVLELQNDDRVDRMLNTAVDMVSHDTQPEEVKPETVFEQPPSTVAPRATAAAASPAVQPTSPSKVVQMPQKQPQPSPVGTVEQPKVDTSVQSAPPTQATPEALQNAQGDPGDESEATGTSFDAELDAELAALMGK